MAEVDLTEAMIASAMAKAEARVCPAGDHRCYPLPSNVAAARATCTPKGRCKVGWVVRKSGRESWDVWLEVSAGLVKLVPQSNGHNVLRADKGDYPSAPLAGFML
jgi:hypothetical protein